MVYPGSEGGARNGPVVPDTILRAISEPGESPETRPFAAGADPQEAELHRELTLAFAPIHKRSFGIAVGTTLALLLAALTIFHLLLDRDNEIDISLLRNYFYGYSVSWPGVAIGAFWGFVVGFVGGWFAAFCRNLALAISIFITRTRAELRETRDFLDHI